MIRRRFYSSYKSPVDNGVYAVKQDGRLIPLSKADYQCISVAIVHDNHKIMIEKNEDSNQSYKTATSGLPDSSNKTYSFYWGEYGTDQTGITNIGGQPLDTRYYWSSSEHSSNSGWIVLFNNGRTFTRYKRLTSSVRFVRDIE